MQLPPIQRTFMELGRIVTALCIVGDGVWYIRSYDVRAAYMKELGIPPHLVYLTAIAFIHFGLRILINYHVQSACTGMIITYGIVAFIVHHPVGEGGIGEYPKHINREVNLLNILKYAAVIGGLFQLSGYVDFKLRGMIMQGTQSYAIVLGRSIIGIHFVLESGWFRIYQHELRTTQIKLLGADPMLHVWIVGVISLFGGLNVWMGIPWRRKLASFLLIIMTSILTLMEGSSVATSSGVFHMTFQARFHHVIMSIQIIVGCIMIFTMSEHEAFDYARKKE